MRDTYRLVSGIVFGIVSILQLIRAINGWPVQIGPFAVPLWFSWIAFVVAGALCVWAFRTQRR
ncbi:MAG TPA: hypothetical protein VHE32_12380 [Rhodanobacteraceae bacterium]|jgi:hypothetical protein|nr:hypothetical protein [Rhodanobacteraceae bacterium]